MIEFRAPDRAGGLPMSRRQRGNRTGDGKRETAIAVIGAGFSGTLIALHLLRRCPGNVVVHLIERNRRFGRGLAYSTGNPNHLLNVPAGRMSAFSDRPNDFVEWLRHEGPEEQRDSGAASFVQRTVFGHYVRHLLNDELKSAGKQRLVLSRGEAREIEVTPRHVALRLDRDREIAADIAVLAIGNFPPEAPRIADPGFYDTPFYRPDPWASDTLSDLDPAAPVLLIGTGLTMIDMAVSLLDQGHVGPIHAISRRGLLPHRHAPTRSVSLLDRPLPTAMPALLRFIRAEVGLAERQGYDWRAVVDGLRPALQDVWQSLSEPDRAVFVRHLRRWWDIHRHRMPAATAERIERARRDGRLHIAAARIADFQVRDGAVDVVTNGGGTPHSIVRVARVINCSGPGCDYDRIREPFVRSLLEQGHVRPDSLRLGLDVTPQCALRNERGEISRRLYAVGPVTKAAFWEMTSVPDIRRQCELVAGNIAGLASLMEAQRAAAN
ncbi:MAG: Pyridine nucleotide-disulfide oxidoreductase family [Rhodospirillales bacterium]|nr:Pyridine nucleotide-disulfide oxidoreductase family [Rhodospirillales bacterium]